MKISAVLNFVNCYKNIITNIKTIDSEFKGPKAKIFDQCTDNNFTPFTINEYVLSYNIVDQSLFGGTLPDGAGCWQFAHWTKWAPYIAQNMVQSISPLVGADPSKWSAEDLFNSLGI